MNNTSTTLRPSPRTPALLWWLATLGWAGFIFYLSTETFGTALSGWLLRQILWLFHLVVSPHTFSILHFLFRKLGHLTEYAIFAMLLYGSFGRDHHFEWHARTAWYCVLAAGAYALTDEFHQSIVPGRTASLIDSGIDTVGAAFGIIGIYGHERFFQVRSSRTAAKNDSPAGI